MSQATVDETGNAPATEAPCVTAASRADEERALVDNATTTRPTTVRCLQTVRMATSLEDITSLRLWKGIIAEFVGTLLLVLVGCGSCINLGSEPPSTVQISLCFGLSVATIVWNIGHISGGHINPAVTLALLAARKISLAKAVFFVIFQLVGAVVGAGILMGLTPSAYHGDFGNTLVSKKIDPGKALGVEIFITFVLVFTVFASVDSKRKDINGSTPLSIGLSVTMCHLFAVRISYSLRQDGVRFCVVVFVFTYSRLSLYFSLCRSPPPSHALVSLSLFFLFSRGWSLHLFLKNEDTVASIADR